MTGEQLLERKTEIILVRVISTETCTELQNRKKKQKTKI